MNTRPTPIAASILSFVALVLSGCSPSEQPHQDPSATDSLPGVSPESEPIGDSTRRTVYVPAYSHLPIRESKRNLLSILLSVRNVDSSATITLTQVEYFDTSGHRVRRYLSAPRELRPLETAEFMVEASDDTGGSGANFLVYWEASSDAHPLLTEAIMWGYMGNGYISFKSRGVELDRRPDPSDFEIPSPPASPTPDDSDQGG